VAHELELGLGALLQCSDFNWCCNQWFSVWQTVAMSWAGNLTTTPGILISAIFDVVDLDYET